MSKTTVAAIVRYPDDGHLRILLTRRNVQPYKGYWCFPGGHIELYEPCRAAVVREVKEETGLDFEAEFFCYEDEIIPERDNHAVVMVFEGMGHGSVQARPEEVMETRWVSLEQARGLTLAFTHNNILNNYAAHLEAR